MNTTGQKVKKIRESKNYTQEHVAGMLGISQNTYSKLETGAIKITTDRLQKMAEVLDVPIEQLLSNDAQTNNFTNNHIEKFYAYIEHLKEDNKEHTKMLYEQVKYLQIENERLLTIIEKLSFK